MATLIKGTTLLARLHFLDQQGARQRVLDALPVPDREQLARLVLPVREYSLELNARLDETIARVLFPGEPPPEVFRRLGRASAERNSAQFHSGLAAGDPNDILARSTRVRGQFYSDGEARSSRLGPGEGRIEIWDASTVTLADCESSAGYLQRILELTGATECSVRHEACVLTGNPCCVFACRWKSE